MFAQPDYRRLWAARTVSQLGDTFNFVALALLIYDLTGSGLGVTGVVVAEVLPVLLLAPVAGPLVDRWPRVRVMVGSDLFRLALMVVLALWHDAPVGVYATAFAMSVGAVFFNPAAGSVLPGLVPKDALVAANSGIWTAAVLSQIVLAPLAGLLVTQLGYGPARSPSTPSPTRAPPSSCAACTCRVQCGTWNDAGCWPRPARESQSYSANGCCAHSPSGRSSLRCRQAQPAPCSWYSPKNTSG